jgi:hypothetical protein
MAVRAFLAWSLATAVNDTSAWLFAAALGILVASKAYNVTRAAAVPRLLPDGLTLVTANARTSMAGVVGVVVSAPIAGLTSLIGPEWSLRYAALVFALATVLAIRLPGRVDSSHGEESLGFLSGDTDESRAARAELAAEPTRPHQKVPRARRGRPKKRIPASMAFALRANCGPRWLSGFLTLFMAFLLRAHPIGGHSTNLLLALVIGAAGFGNFAGIAAGSLLKRVNPQITVVLCLLADVAAALFAALAYGLVSLIVLGFCAGLAQSLAKLALDSTIQRDVPERVRTSAFARSDTTLQLAWVIGGFVGIALPLNSRLGLTVAAVVMLAWAVFVFASRPRRPTVAST